MRKLLLNSLLKCHNARVAHRIVEKVMKIMLCSALFGALLVPAAMAGAQSKVKSAQSATCVQDCMSQGWGQDQCSQYCRAREGS
jgi:hypothetical protein